MRVWVLKSGEPVHTDPGRQRLHRTGVLADTFAERGHEVVWWTSSFRHADKQFRYNGVTCEDVHERLRIWFLPTRPYQKKVSFARIRFNLDIARAFRAQAERERPPDVILAAYPIPELAEAAALYAKKRGIPTIIDVRDLWPDIWLTAIPAFARPAARIALLPFHHQCRRTLRLFDGICGPTDEMVEWGLAKAGRPRGSWDRAFPLAYPANVYSEAEKCEAEEFWRTTLSGLPPAKLKLCFFGNLAMQRARIDVMIDAMRQLSPEVRSQTRLVLCGMGEDVEAVRAMAADIPQIIMPGWVTAPQIEVIALQSDAGILPYPSLQDFTIAVPNKAVEYLAHSLPILTSLRGPVSRLIQAEHCGILYRETDPADLAQKIMDLFQAPNELKRLSANADRVFRENFLATEVYGRVADMLTELVASPRSDRPSA